MSKYTTSDGKTLLDFDIYSKQNMHVQQALDRMLDTFMPDYEKYKEFWESHNSKCPVRTISAINQSLKKDNAMLDHNLTEALKKIEQMQAGNLWNKPEEAKAWEHLQTPKPEIRNGREQKFSVGQDIIVFRGDSHELVTKVKRIEWHNTRETWLYYFDDKNGQEWLEQDGAIKPL